jgi:hypothetical protein
MKKLSMILVALLIVLIVGAGVFLATWNIPAPVTKVEKVLPDDRFPR